MKSILSSLIFSFILAGQLVGQISSNSCSNAGQLCPNQIIQVDNLGATIISCFSCEDDFNICFTPLNTAWFTFNTYNDGDVNLEISNLQFNPNINNQNNSLNFAVFSSDVPCFSPGYVLTHCFAGVAQNGTESITGLTANSTYYVVFSGSQDGPTALAPSEATFEIELSGSAVDRDLSAVSIGLTPEEICMGSPVTVQADGSLCQEIGSFTWHKNGVFWIETLGSSISTMDVENGDQIQLFTTCYEDCPVEVSSNIVDVVVYDFLVDAGPDLLIAQNGSIQLQGSTSESSFFWSPPTDLSSPNTINPIASPDISLTYFLTATNGICEITDSMRLTVLSDLIVPDAFTPNNDGINDVWEILGTEHYDDVYVLVYDRSGQKVLEAVNYNPLRFWNGTFRGRELPTTTYFYVITLNRNSSSERILKGPVTIVR